MNEDLESKIYLKRVIKWLVFMLKQRFPTYKQKQINTLIHEVLNYYAENEERTLIEAINDVCKKKLN